MKRIAVTGGAGFVGTNLVRRLCQMGYEVVVLDDLSTGLRSNLEGLNCDLRNISIVEEKETLGALKGVDYIFHLAARGSVPRSIRNPNATFEVNTRGTLNILSAAREIGASLAFSSSSSVYGSNPELPKNEKMWMAPLTPYAASKLAGEALVQSYGASFGLPVITYRFFNIFGPWQRPDHDYAAVIPKWIWKASKNEQIEVFGDGEQTRDFTFVDSVVSILIDGMERSLTHPIPVNLAFGNRISLNSLLDQLRMHFPNLRVEHVSIRKGDVRDSQNDAALLREIFPSIKPISFERGIEATLNWLVSEGQRVAGQSIDAD